MRRMHDLGFAVLGIDYRGFGQSTAALPSEDFADEDARAAWRWLAQRQPNAKRYLFGHSLGSAIAVRLASEAEDVAGLIVEGGFTSIPDVVSTMKWGWLPVGGLITQRFDAASRVEKVKAPLLVVHGERDTLIQPALGPRAVREGQVAQALRAGRRRHAPQHQLGGAGGVPAGSGRTVRPADRGAVNATRGERRAAPKPARGPLGGPADVLVGREAP